LFEAHLEERRQSTDSRAAKQTRWSRCFARNLALCVSHKAFMAHAGDARMPASFNRFAGGQGHERVMLKTSEFERNLRNLLDRSRSRAHLTDPRPDQKLVRHGKAFHGRQAEVLIPTVAKLFITAAGQ